MLVTYSGLANGGTGGGTAVAGVAIVKSRVGYGRIVALGSGVATVVGETAVAGSGVVASGVGLMVRVVVGTAVAVKGWFVAMGKRAITVGVGKGDDWQATPSKSVPQRPNQYGRYFIRIADYYFAL